MEFQTLPFDPFAQVVALLWLARLAAHPATSFSPKKPEKSAVFIFYKNPKIQQNVLSFSSVFQNLVFETLSPPFPVRVASDMKETSNDIIRHFCSLRASKDAFVRKGQKTRQGGLQRLHSPMYLWLLMITYDYLWLLMCSRILHQSQSHQSHQGIENGQRIEPYAQCAIWCS